MKTQCWAVCNVYRSGRKAGGGRVRDYSPLAWNAYFAESRDIHVDGETFRVYESGSEGPLLLLLHGGGFSALTWSLFNVSFDYYFQKL